MCPSAAAHISRAGPKINNIPKAASIQPSRVFPFLKVIKPPVNRTIAIEMHAIERKAIFAGSTNPKLISPNSKEAKQYPVRPSGTAFPHGVAFSSAISYLLFTLQLSEILSLCVE
jgi:hypothetical protein